jgi:predicted ATPase
MITKLRLKNWKSFKDSTLYIDPLTILIGINASGKSNVLDALDFIRKIAAAKSGNTNDLLESIRGGKNWLIKRGENSCELDITVVSDDQEIVYSLSTDGETIYRSAESKASDETIKKAQAQLKDIFVFNPVPEKMRGYSPVSSELKPDGSNIAGVIASLPKDEKEKLEAELTRYVSPLPEKDIRKIQSVTVGLNNSDAMLYCYEEWNPDKPIDARGMSDGTLRFAAIVLALLTAKPHSLLVIEEIDNGLHPSRAKELVKVMKELSQKRSVDILCTTHNPVLINELGNEMIPFISYVKRDSEGNSVIELLEEKDNLAKLMASSTIGGIMTEDKL